MNYEICVKLIFYILIMIDCCVNSGDEVINIYNFMSWIKMDI